jgi:hypothetical protein
MPGASRDRVTIDLRGIGDAVRAAAVCRGMGVAQLVRRALVISLDLRATAAVAPMKRALLASNDRMSALSTDLVALVTLLRQVKVEQARPYRDRLETADAEIRRHLDRASALIDRL